MADVVADFDQPFRFFDLPVELREWTFDYVRDEEELKIAEPPCEAHLSIKDHPLTNVLLASHQLKQEYEKRASKKTVITFSDHENFDFTLLPLPAKVVDIKNIEVRMFVVCENKCPQNRSRCEASSDLAQSRDLIAKILLQLPAATSLEIKLGLWCTSDSDHAWQQIHDKSLMEGIQDLATQIPKLARLFIYRSEERMLDTKSMTDGRAPLARWEKGHGWLTEDVPDANSEEHGQETNAGAVGLMPTDGEGVEETAG